MKLRKNHLIHWLAAFAIAMSALAPAVSQAVSLAKHGQGFAMELCSADGAKLMIDVQTDDQDVASQAKSCQFCLTHVIVTAAFNTHLSFEAPTSFALLPKLFYQSPKPLAVWVTPPSAAPPAQA